MNGSLTIERLVCPRCGSALEGNPECITFQCAGCYNYFIISRSGLKEIRIRGALPNDGISDDSIFLPFWSIEIDTVQLRIRMLRSLERIRKTVGEIAAGRIENGGELEDASATESGSGTARLRMLAGLSNRKAAPGGREIETLLSSIESAGSFRVYVPAFPARNPFAYLKAGRFFTKNQPVFKTDPSVIPGRSVMCSVDQREAEGLIDFMFFATLPSSILKCGEFLENVSLSPAGRPELINFPFTAGKRSIVSQIGGFNFSRRLIELTGP